MAPATVSSSILTIVTSFANGLEVLQKLKDSTRKGTSWSKASKRSEDDELRLSRSLCRGMNDIGCEYQKASTYCDAERFAVGDAIAQNSLAEILIEFNTGLVSIITFFLNTDKREKVVLDYRSLTELSDRSRTQSISTIRQLYHRILNNKFSTPTAPARPRKQKVNSRHRSPSKHTKPRNHPTLARVFIENSSIPSQIALVRPSEIKKQRSRTQSYQSLIHQPPMQHSVLTPRHHHPTSLPTLSLSLQATGTQNQSHHHVTTPPAPPSTDHYPG